MFKNEMLMGAIFTALVICYALALASGCAYKRYFYLDEKRDIICEESGRRGFHPKISCKFVCPCNTENANPGD